MIYSELSVLRGSHHRLHLGRNSNAGIKVEEQKLKLFPDWGLLAQGDAGRLGQNETLARWDQLLYGTLWGF